MASLPLFFHDAPLKEREELWLDEDTARHVVQVLRMLPGEALLLTDGKGNVADTTISSAAKKKCSVLVNSIKHYPEPKYRLHLAVGFTKNTSRNEWLLEKATELGASSIIPLSVARTERERTRHDRWQTIITSAMLQSQQYYLPHLAELTPLKNVLEQYNAVTQKCIAHCNTSMARKPVEVLLKKHADTIILIGPEGDFTEEEVTLCEQHGFAGISLAQQRLRTETAAMAVCAYFNTINNEEI